MTTVPVFRGEFGLMVRFHVPRVHAMPRPKVVEIEEGNEALYPSAVAWKVVARRTEDEPEDSRARGKVGRPQLTGPEARFVPEPWIRQHVGAPDIVVCPRWRHYVSEKNWPHWPVLVEWLASAGARVFAGGVADSSDTRVEETDCDFGWNYQRPLDATIEAMRTAKLVVAPCSGLAHLAVLCGTPLLLFTYRGLDAPGPVINSAGRRVQPQRWPVRKELYYDQANHLGSMISMIDGWEHPDSVAERAMVLLRGRE